MSQAPPPLIDHDLFDKQEDNDDLFASAIDVSMKLYFV